MQILKATAGIPIKIHLHDDVLVTGLTADDFTAVAFSNTALMPSVALAVNEIQAGHYTASVTFNSVDSYYLSISYSTYAEKYQVEVEKESISFLAGKMAAAEGDYEITVTDSEDAIVPGALVRVYNSTDTRIITKGTTNQSGKIRFALEVGSYKARISKDGYNFSSINPVSFTVTASDEVNPIIEEFLPTSVTPSSTLCVRGLNFSSTTVAFIDGTETSLSSVSKDGNVVLVDIPSDAATSITFELGNPDPNNAGSHLKSELYNILVTS